jgi:hypothetical protein
MKGAQIMERKLSRRELLMIGGAAIGGAATGCTTTTMMAKKEDESSVPWTWKEIKPEDVQERAYRSAWAKVGCMYGVLEGILGTLGDRYGSPYKTFPVEATVYGSGGLGGVGSLCGAVNACGMLFGLFAKNQEDMFAMCNEISLWYEKAELPVYIPKNPQVEISNVSSVANSNLCHISSTVWANASGYKVMTPEHFERCNRLVVDVAMKAVSMLNDYNSAKIVFKEKLNAFSQSCMACHGPGKMKSNVETHMSCNACHEDPH